MEKMNNGSENGKTKVKHLPDIGLFLLWNFYLGSPHGRHPDRGNTTKRKRKNIRGEGRNEKPMLIFKTWKMNKMKNEKHEQMQQMDMKHSRSSYQEGFGVLFANHMRMRHIILVPRILTTSMNID